MEKRFPIQERSVRDVTGDLVFRFRNSKQFKGILLNVFTFLPDDLLSAKISSDKAPHLVAGIRDQLQECLGAHGPKPAPQELARLLEPIIQGFLEAEETSSHLVAAMSLQGRHPGAHNPRS